MKNSSASVNQVVISVIPFKSVVSKSTAILKSSFQAGFKVVKSIQFQAVSFSSNVQGVVSSAETVTFLSAHEAAAIVVKSISALKSSVNFKFPPSSLILTPLVGVSISKESSIQVQSELIFELIAVAISDQNW
jgi:hypothetical protein